MGIEPTPRTGSARGNGFEDRGSHQAPSASVEKSSTRDDSGRPAARGRAGALAAVAASVPVRVAFLALLLAAAYAGALRAGVAWDDTYLISGNPAIRTLARPWRFFVDPWTLSPVGGNAISQYRPLRTLFFACQFAVFGGNAWGFHLVSILLHALAAYLVGTLTHALFGRGRWLAATVWLLHPAVSENVLYLAAQGNLLCLVFGLLAVLAHLRWLETGATRRRAASLAWFLLALGAYEFGAVLPVLLIVAEIVWRRRGEAFRAGAVRRHLPFWVVLAAFVAVRTAVALPVPRNPWWAGSWLAALGCQLRIWVEAWRLTVLPLSQKIRYLPPDIPDFAPLWVAILLHVALAALVVLALRTGRYAVAAACVVWWYAAQAPTSNVLVTNLGYMFAPRFLFLALVLPVAAFAAWLNARAARRVVLGAVAAGALAAVALVQHQVATFQSALSLNREIIRANSNDFGGHYTLGWSLLLAGDRDGAGRELEAARALAPAWPLTHFLLGELRAAAGDLQAAHGEYSAVIRTDPAYLEPRIRLAEISLLARQLPAARDWMATVGSFDRLDPFARARFELSLARLELALGDATRVAARVDRALATWTHTADVLFESGVLLSYSGQHERGRALLARAAERAGRDYYDMVGDSAWLDLALLRPLSPLTPPRLFARFSVPVVGP